jgi:cyclophilin family peptidyl-prolyl cis-trans isomerase/HEAT repeat protein
MLSILVACATAPPQVVPERPRQTFEEKMAWILRLEEDRVLRLPPPELPPPPVIAPARRNRAPVVAPPPPPPPDLITLLRDDEARIRRRAALAVGRVRLPEAIEPLSAVLADTDPEVRQMAAFALGLIGDVAAADALSKALADSDPLVQGRAAEALGLITHKPAAAAIGTMIGAQVKAGAFDAIAPDDLEYPKGPVTEAARLGMYALVRLGAYDALATALVDGAGQPVSRWWPVAYAFQRVADAKAGPVLLTLLQGQGAMTRAFAARGLGVIKEQRAIAPLIALIGKADEPASVRIQAVRALAALGARQAIDPLTKIVATAKADPNLRLEVLTALGQMNDPQLGDLFVDLLTETWPSMRAAAFIALARADPDLFLGGISGLDPDPHWSVRAALATALGTLDALRAEPRLTLMLDDGDQRVIPAVLNALVAVKSATAEKFLISRLNADDLVVRQAAANGLARLKSRAAIAPLVSAYERAEKDPAYVAGAAILAALVDLDPKAAQPLLERALGDRDWALRVRAAALLRKIDPAADVSRMRPAPGAGPPELNDLKALIAPPVSPMAYIDTEKGLIQIELAVLDAPRTVANFVALARRNFLGATPFHRVVPDFVAQDGDPRGDGEGGPGYTIRDEINQRPYLRGTVGMALDWEDTGGSQFFITHSPQPHLDARYTVFGRVVAGMDVVDRLQQWDQIRTVRIWDGQNWIGAQ